MEVSRALVDLTIADLEISADKVSKFDSLPLPEHETNVDHDALRSQIILCGPLTRPQHQPLQRQKNQSLLLAFRKDEVVSDEALEDWS